MRLEREWEMKKEEKRGEKWREYQDFRLLLSLIAGEVLDDAFSHGHPNSFLNEPHSVFFTSLSL